jgi:peptidoglycan/LPS O-acetylase OafA/YrhL
VRPVPGLDGLRGVAVLAVMAFHAGLAAAGGGLLGVDVFFVLSGFLVTSLLLAEYRRSGTIALRSFWARRARRLLPALFISLAGIAAYARWAADGLAPHKLRGDALATLFYGANWHYVLTGQNYFVKYGAPSPLLHTWSLAVEEQFYLVWPVLAWLVLRRCGSRGLAWVAGGFAACSALACAVLYLNGASVNRLYYGTDTRAQSLMVGALLAGLVPMAGSRTRDVPSGATPGRRMRGTLVVAVLGYAGLLILGYSLHAVRGDGPFLYEGGFLVVAVATAAVVAVTVRRPFSWLAKALSVRPLRYTGRISYGLYLYHWPLFLVLTGARTGLSGYPLLGIRFLATFLVADASYRFVENPVRTGRWPLSRFAPRWPGRPGWVVGVTAVAASLLVLGALLTFAIRSPSQRVTLAAVSSPPAGYVAPSGASASNPIHALLLGDSMALTLGEGLSQGASAWGVSVDNKGSLGCDLDPQTTVNVMGTVSQTAQGCPRWQATWPRLIAQTNPDVVFVLLGRWESLDRKYGGRWTHVGEPDFDTHLQSELSQVVAIGASRGAKVILLTLPYIAQTTEQPDGSPWDMNLPSRTDAYNADVRAVAARQPTRASVLDLNKLLDPGGHYASKIDGVQVRDYDEEHLSLAGGLWLRPYLLPELAKLGAAHFEARVGSPAPS